MVCAKCENKLSKVICPEPWKAGARNTNESGGRKLNENKLLTKRKKWTPQNTKCKICKTNLHQEAKYCQGCAYSKGICAMCGKQILDVTNYKQSTT
jgi:hypothetical protein